MRKKKPVDGKEPRGRYFAVVEEKVDAVRDNNFTRSTLLLDGVNATAFEASEDSVGDIGELSLLRAMTTDSVWENVLQAGQITPGDWVEVHLDDDGNAPMAWEMHAINGYSRGPKRSLRRLSRIGRATPGGAATGDRPELAASLSVATNRARGSHDTVPLQDVASVLLPGSAQLLPARQPDVEFRVLDVGQASCVLVSIDGDPVLLFDAGSPIWFNKGSLKLPIVPPDIGDSTIFLSHWDWDHFDLGRRTKAWHHNRWLAPDQIVSPNTALFQRQLGSNLTFVAGPLQIGDFRFEQGTSLDPLDRNNSGYQLRFERNNQAVLLAGDTDYAHMLPTMTAGLTHLCIPHHGGRGSTPPAPANQPGRAVVSYGSPNSYRHPNIPQMNAHGGLGWRIEPTADHVGMRRGDRVLFP